MDYAEKMQRCHEYVEALEEEKRKIQVFQRELPLCLELVTQAIEACRRELSGTTTEYMHGQSECSEQTSTAAPVLEEFMPLKSPDCNDHDQHSEEDDNKKATNNRDKNGDSKKKSDWLRSVQLWNNNNNQFTESDPSPPPKVEEVGRKATVVEVKKNGGAFQPFHKEKSAGKNNDTTTNTDQAKSVGKTNNSPAAVPATSSTTETVSNKSGGGSGGTSKKEEKEKEKEGQRKQRRCWSPELHRRFLHALQQLGGSHVATPKQIRELMKVDGLTNDEVKSHLQKYRLHTRRPTPTIHNNGTTQAPQFVVVGGIWVPPPEYAATASKQPGEATVVANKIYAPVAAPPPCSVGQSSVSLMQSEHMNSDERNLSHSEGAIHSSSPATSSSTHTTTASPTS